MKLTASTITTASISTLTNSPTERDTAVGWSWTCVQLDAHRQVGADRRGRRLQRLAQRDDVAALGHRDAQRDDLLALVAHLHLRRVDVGALDLGDVAQAQRAGRAGAGLTARIGKRSQLLDRVELPADAHLQVLGRRR